VFCAWFLIQFDKSAIRASGLIPDIPHTVIIKILNFQSVLKDKRSITDDLAGFITAIYTSQIVYIMYCTIQSMNRDLVGLHVEVGRQGSYQRYDVSPFFPPPGGKILGLSESLPIGSLTTFDCCEGA
jgi:hypothetical protein